MWTSYNSGDIIEEGKYLVTSSNRNVYVAFFKKEMFDLCFIMEIVAFMKCPEPYMGEIKLK